MSAETAIFAALDADAGVHALVANRIYPDLRPQETALPAVVYRRASTSHESTIHGQVYLRRAQIDLDCIAVTRAGAEAIADAVESALNTAGMPPIDRAGGFDPDSRDYFARISVEHITI